MSKGAEWFGAKPRLKRYGIITEKQRMNKMMQVMNHDEQLMKHGCSMKKRRTMKTEERINERMTMATAQERHVESLLQQDSGSESAEKNPASAWGQNASPFGAAPEKHCSNTSDIDERQMQHGSTMNHDGAKTCPRTCLTCTAELPQSCPTEASLRHLPIPFPKALMRIIGETSVHINKLKKLRRMLLGGLLPC